MIFLTPITKHSSATIELDDSNLFAILHTLCWSHSRFDAMRADKPDGCKEHFLSTVRANDVQTENLKGDFARLRHLLDVSICGNVAAHFNHGPSSSMAWFGRFSRSANHCLPCPFDVADVRHTRSPDALHRDHDTPSLAIDPRVWLAACADRRSCLPVRLVRTNATLLAAA